MPVFKRLAVVLTAAAVGSLLTLLVLASTTYGVLGFWKPAEPNHAAVNTASAVHANMNSLFTQRVHKRNSAVFPAVSRRATVQHHVNRPTLRSAFDSPGTSTNASDAEGYLAFCVLARNEGPYFSEWLQYHNAAGGSKFYVYDHASEPPLRAALDTYIRSDLVEYEFLELSSDGIRGSRNRQPEVYTTCIRQHGQKHTWMAFIDMDEFIVTADGRRLPDLLAPYEDVGALALKWKVFGSSGHVAKPSQGVLEAYTECFKHCIWKNILRTRGRNLNRVTLNDNAHTFVNLPRGYFTVTTDRAKNAGWKNCHPLLAPLPTNRTLDDSLFSVAYLHHYATKSMEEFVEKSHRHATGIAPPVDMGGPRLGLEYFFKINSYSKPGPACALP
jgi:hypothetical protein